MSDPRNRASASTKVDFPAPQNRASESTMDGRESRPPMSFTSLWEMEWQRLKSTILSDPSLGVLDMQLYGSRLNGFGENADVDATVLVPGRDAVPVLQMLEGALPRLLPYYVVLERVYAARVPILRLRGNGLDFDLSVNNLLPVWNTSLLKSYAELDPRAVTLVRAVKRWAKVAEVVGAPSGNLSSYALTSRRAAAG